MTSKNNKSKTSNEVKQLQPTSQKSPGGSLESVISAVLLVYRVLKTTRNMSIKKTKRHCQR